MTDPRLTRALAFERWMHAAAGRVITASWGQVFLDASLARCYERNQARTAPEAGGLDAGALDDELERIFARERLGHRQVCVEPPAAARLAPGLRERGYDHARHRFMAFGGPTPSPPRADVVELGLDTALAAQDLYLATDPDTPYGRDPRTRADLLEHHRTYGAAAGERRFGILARGRAVAWAKLWARDGVAQVEDVVVDAGHRGRGYARDVVAAATRAALVAGPQLVFIVADAEDWPQQLYERLGYAGVGELAIFTRSVPDSPGPRA